MADAYDRKMKRIGVNADWFETQQKYEVKKTKKINDIFVKKDLIFTNDEIKLRRHIKLKDLYVTESSL